MAATPEAPPQAPSDGSSHRTGGRGARQRILEAATGLFYGQGINATGVEELAERAHVSKRTLYQHFSSKDELVAAYLTRMGEAGRLPGSATLARSDLTPREKLLAVFEIGPGFRGCPFNNAAAELCDPAHPARSVALANKQGFMAELVAVAREAGARQPELLGHQLAVLNDGAAAQAVTLSSAEPVAYARAAAEVLIDLALR
jgi:AcrR family transcriptional regulator